MAGGELTGELEGNFGDKMFYILFLVVHMILKPG